jgi:hypothetical protein
MPLALSRAGMTTYACNATLIEMDERPSGVMKFCGSFAPDALPDPTTGSLASHRRQSRRRRDMVCSL